MHILVKITHDAGTGNNDHWDFSFDATLTFKAAANTQQTQLVLSTGSTFLDVDGPVERRFPLSDAKVVQP